MHPDRRPNPDRSPEALEGRLRALPQPPVPAGLEARLLASIPAARSISRRRWVVLAGAAGVLAAACLAAVIAWQGSDGKNATTPGTRDSAQLVTPKPPHDSSGIASWREARRVLDGSEIPAFAWPLEERSPITVFTSIPPDLLD
jgi:ferric-dicitrate binding protein FerR (iron transport regulator)